MTPQASVWVLVSSSCNKINLNYSCLIAKSFIITHTFIPMTSRQDNKSSNNYDELYQIQCKFDRSNSTYKPQQVVSGTVSLIHKQNNNFKVDIQAITLNIWGGISIQNRQNKPEIEEIIRKIPPIPFISLPNMVIAKNKTLTPDTKIPFRFKLQKGDHRYAETYIGVYLSVSYTVKVHMKMSSLRKIEDQSPFYLQVPKAGRQAIDDFVYPKKKNFMVVSSEIKGEKNKIPIFKIRGELQSEICFFNDDLNGFIIVDLADSPIRSIDLQMLRVQKIQSQFKTLSQKTEIQLIQICDGNVTRNMQIPLYMILPRYYSCPSVKYLWCNINFEVNLQIIFKDGYKVSVNIPLKLIRS